MNIIVADIGGTNCRFALAELTAAGVAGLSAEAVFRTAQHASLQIAWRAYAAQLEAPLPRAAAIAIASPVNDDLVKLTNSPWVIRQSELKRQLDLDDVLVLNDFAAMGHAVARLGDERLRPVCGARTDLPRDGVISVIGPGTGLGVAQILRRADGYEVLSTEGGHTSFAPFDELDDLILRYLRRHYPRVSAERVVSGPGLLNIYAALAELENVPLRFTDDKALWTAALSGEDTLAAAALERFCLCFGVVAGDIALAHGAAAVVIASGLSLRIGDRLMNSGFSQRFAAKGRFESAMEAMPVKLVGHEQPGLFGAAAAFAWRRARAASPGT